MKIGKIFGKNFGKTTEISVNIDPALTYFIGPNKSGKTTTGLTIVWFAMQGLAQRGDGVIAERWRFIGPMGKSALTEIEIHDDQKGVVHTVTRKLLKDKTELKIKSSDGVVRGQEFLDSIFSTIFFDLRKFPRMSGKEQALALGIDTSAFDQERKKLKQIRHDIGVKVQELKGVAKASRGAEKVEEVSIAELLEVRKAAEKFNAEVGKREVAYQDLIDQHQDTGQDIHNLKKQLIEKRATKQRLTREINDFEKIPSRQNLTEIDQKIEAAEGTNAKARAYQQSLIDDRAYNNKKAEYDAETAKIQDLDARLAQYLDNQKLPFNNITIEAGEFRLNSSPFREPYFSTGELLKFTARIADKIMEKQEQKLEYVWIPGCQDIDEPSREELFETLIQHGYQLACEFVDTKKQKKGLSILLKEMEVVETYDETKKGAELV